MCSAFTATAAGAEGTHVQRCAGLGAMFVAMVVQVIVTRAMQHATLSGVSADLGSVPSVRAPRRVLRTNSRPAGQMHRGMRVAAQHTHTRALLGALVLTPPLVGC